MKDRSDEMMKLFKRNHNREPEMSARTDDDALMIMALEKEIESLEQLVRDMWPLMALKTKWLEKHPEHRERIERLINEN